MRAIDLCCKAGGVSCGLTLAGYEVVGVDVEPQPRYPYEFIQRDALTMTVADLRQFDLVWASPPCQGYTRLVAPGQVGAPRLIEPFRRLLKRAGVPYVIENVPGAPLINPVTLCGSMFGLEARWRGRRYQLQRHREFETSFTLPAPAHAHRSPVVGVYGGHARCRAASYGGRRTRDPWPHLLIASQAMGIDWMTLEELSEAIPPAYAKFIGEAARCAA